MFEYSDEIGEIATAVATAQSRIEAARRSSINPTFNSRYADLSAVRQACIPTLAEAGVAVFQAPSTEVLGPATIADRPGPGGQPPRSEARALMRVSVTTMFVHGSSGQWIRSTLSTLVADGTVWPMGSAITYLSRYALATMAGIALTDDDGGVANERRPHLIIPEGSVRSEPVPPAPGAIIIQYEGNPDDLQVYGAGGGGSGTGHAGQQQARGPRTNGGRSTLQAPVPPPATPVANQRPTGGQTTAPRRVLRNEDGAAVVQPMAEQAQAANATITPQQATQLNQLLTAVGVRSRDHKLDWIQATTGRRVASLRALTTIEARLCLESVERMAAELEDLEGGESVGG